MSTRAITYNGSDDEAWHSFEEIPIDSIRSFNGKEIQIHECHNPNKWAIYAKYDIKGDQEYTSISLYLQRDFPFKIFTVSKQVPYYGKSSHREYRHIPIKYEWIYDLFISIIEERKKTDPDFVCGILTYKDHILPAYVNPENFNVSTEA